MPTQDFANEMGFSLRRILLGENDALETLGGLAYLDRSQVKEMISWSGEPLGEVRMCFRGETYVSRALRGTQVRGCSYCLREDIGEVKQRPLRAHGA